MRLTPLFESYVTFETAKLAHEIGMPLLEKPFGYITKFYEPKTGSMRSYGLSGRDPFENLYYAPLQSVMQRWLREKHNLHIHMMTTRDGKWLSSVVMLEKDVGFMGTLYNHEDSKHAKDTYEDALEIGLQTALTLIDNED